MLREYLRLLAKIFLLTISRCLTCRKRKQRCDGRKPTCETCSENGHECLGYAADGGDRKRSIDSGQGGEEYREEYVQEGTRRQSNGSDKHDDSAGLHLQPALEGSLLPHNVSHRVPYFRYFGPTAIVPGFKQMVVSVREHRRSTGAASSIPS